jgi:hypothetical protein
LEYNMSLPAAQQRLLDGIADGLRRSEPKLAAMYGIFTRLCSSEAPPRREQLTAARGWRSRLGALDLHLARPARGGRRTLRRVLILSQVAIAFVLLSVLIGLNWHTPAGCGSPGQQHTVALARLGCPANASSGVMPGK